MAASLTAMAVRPSTANIRGTAVRAAQNGSRTVMAADRAIWLPGGDFPKRECAGMALHGVSPCTAWGAKIVGCGGTGA